MKNSVLDTVSHGIYKCYRCAKPYTVDDGTFRRCSPAFCHDCLEHLNKQSLMMPYPEPKH